MTTYYYLCHKRKVIFTEMPKNGCESIRHLILREEGIYENPKDIWNKINHGYKGITYKISGDDIKNFMEKNSDYKLLTIIRNPFTRLVSGYFDKIIRPENVTYPYCKRVIIAHGRKRQTSTTKVSFEEFVNYIIKEDKQTLDYHYRPQTNLFDITIRNNEMLKMEDIPNIKKRLKELGFKEEYTNYNKVIKKEYQIKIDIKDINIYKQYGEFYKIFDKKYQPKTEYYYKDEELKKKVYEFYKKDFELLNYSK